MISVDAATSRISDKPGHDTATVEFTPTGSPIRAWRTTFGADRMDPPLEKRGVVCGMGDRCGEGLMPLRLDDGSQIESSFTYADLPPSPDGTYQIGVHAHGEGPWL